MREKDVQILMYAGSTKNEAIGLLEKGSFILQNKEINEYINEIGVDEFKYCLTIGDIEKVKFKNRIYYIVYVL